jgi:hypothetical protein
MPQAFRHVSRNQAPILGDIRRQSPFHGVRRSKEP